MHATATPTRRSQHSRSAVRRTTRRVVVEPRDARLALRTHARYDAQLLDALDRLVAA